MSIPPQANYYTHRYIGVNSQIQKPTPQEEGVNPPDAFGTTQATTSNITPQNTTTKPKGNNPWLWGAAALAGTALAIGASVVGIKAYQASKSLKETPELLESIFEKKMTKEELLKTVDNYHDLLQIKDKDDFITQAFHQVKKDFGYENVPIKLKIETSPIDSSGLLQGKGMIAGDILSIHKEKDKNSILSTIAHEFTHLRQDEFMSRAGLIPEVYEEKTFQALSRLDRNNPNDVKTAKEFAQEMKDEYEELFKPLNRKPITPEMPEYAMAQRYADSAKNYINDDKAKYDASLIEQEAKTAGKKMERFIQIIQGNFKTNGAS